ncbi:unnamed protein product [Parajaminaea phylloscopi]
MLATQSSALDTDVLAGSRSAAHMGPTMQASSASAAASRSGLGPSIPPRRKTPSRGLSLSIPPGSEAYGGLTPLASALDTAPPVSAIDAQPPLPLFVHQGLQPLKHTDAALTSTAAQDPVPASFSPPRVPATRKRPSRLLLNASASATTKPQNSYSVPSSPVVGHYDRRTSQLNATGQSPGGSTTRPRPDVAPIQEEEKQNLRQTLTGKPRRRPSMPFSASKRAQGPALRQIDTPSSESASRPPEVWRDPSQDILSGRGSTLQHARSVYAAGPIEVLPGLFLGDEHNARDDGMLARANITTILNVAKETILPFQDDKDVTPLLSSRRGSRVAASECAASRGKRAMSYTVAGPSSQGLSTRPVTDTVMTGSPRVAAQVSSGQAPVQTTPPPSAQTIVTDQAASSSRLLRSALSTPNLQAQFQNALSRNRAAGGDQDGSSAQTHSGSQLHSTCSSDVSEDGKPSRSWYTESTAPTSADATHPADVGESGTEDPSSLVLEQEEAFAFYSAVELPPDALKLTVPPSPQSGRSQPIRYIKLPWTHDQNGLALRDGGFAQGCAVIAEALAIDHYGQRLTDESGNLLRPGNVLVHCQCGVSRSATLAIAFVMQAAALNYPYEATKNLTGMHDCYNLVKDLSASISPNISLIFQLVEWERHLSVEAVRLREALRMQTDADQAGSAQTSAAAAAAPGATEPIGWSHEVMGEEEWTRMRMEEEKKEQQEYEVERQRRLAEAMTRQAADRQAETYLSVVTEPLQSALGGDAYSTTPSEKASQASGGGLSARRRKRTPSLRLGGGQGETQSSSDDLADGRSSGSQASKEPGPSPLVGHQPFRFGSSTTPADAGGSGTGNMLPLRSARLGGSFPLQPPSTAKEVTSLVQQIPSLYLGATEAIQEEEEPPLPRITMPVDLTSPGLSQPSESPALPTDGIHLASPPQATLRSLPTTSPGHTYVPSIANENADIPDDVSTARTARARPRSFQLGSPSSLGLSGMSAMRPSRSSSGHAATSLALSSLSPPPSLNLSLLLNDPPKADFGHFARDAKLGSTSQHRKQQHRRTFSSEPVNWDAIRVSLATAAVAPTACSTSGTGDASRPQPPE